MKNPITFSLILSSLMVLLPSVSAEIHTLDVSQGREENGVIFYDAQLLPVEGKGWTDTESFYDRLPAKAKGVVREPVWNLSRFTTGLLVRFKTTSKDVTVRWTLTRAQFGKRHHAPTGVSGVDLYGLNKDGVWQYLSTKMDIQSLENEAAFWNGSHQFREFLLYMPLFNGIEKLEVGVRPGSTLGYETRERPRVVIYGTSITHGACASRPGLSFPAIVGRKLNVEIINLGFSGNGKIEPEMAHLLAELDPDLFIIDPLRNNSPEDLKEKYEPFLRTLLRARPDTPMLLADDAMFTNAPSKRTPVVLEVMQKLQAEGVKTLHFLPNEGMLGYDYEGTVDGTHPNDLGMMRMAAVFTPAVSKLLGLE